MNVFKMVGSIALQGGDKASEQLKTFDENGKKTGKSFKESFKKVGTAVLGVATAITAVIGTVGALSNKVIKLTDNIDKQSQKIGISRKAYQEWDFILSQNGTSVNGLQMTMKTLSKASSEAKEGVVTYTDEFEKLNVTVTNADGTLKDSETLFNEVFLALSQMEDITQRSAIATALLGRSGTELAPAFNSGAEAIENLRLQAHEYGLVVDDEAIDAGVRLTDTVDRIKRSFQSAMINAVSPFLPKLEIMATGISDKVIPKIISLISWVNKMALTVPVLFNFMKGALEIIGNNIVKVLENPLKKIKAFVDEIFKVFGFEGFEDGLETTWNFICQITGDIYDALKKGFSTGDWGDLFGITSDIIKAGIVIAISLSTAKIVAGAIFAKIGTALVGASVGFKAISMPMVLAGASIALQIFDELQAPSIGWQNFAKNMFTAIAVGLGVGAFTGPIGGLYAFSVAMNIKLGDIFFKKDFSDTVLADYQKHMTGIVGQVTESSQKEIGNIISGVNWFGTNSAQDKLAKIYGTNVGKQMLDGVGIGLEDIEELGNQSAQDLLFAIKDALGIRSPSKETEYMGRQLIAGFVNGLGENYPELKALFETLLTDLDTIWIDPVEDKVNEVIDEITDEKQLNKWEVFWGKVKDISNSALVGIGTFFSDTFTGIASGLSGKLSTGITGFQEGFEKYRKTDDAGEPVEGATGSMIGGGLAGMAVGLAMESTQFTELMEKLDPVIQKLIDTFGMLLEPLLPLVDVLANMLGPLIEGLSPFFEAIGNVIAVLFDIIIQFIPILTTALMPILKIITWTLNKVILPIIKALWFVLSTWFNTVAGAINYLVRQLNKIVFVNIKWRMPTMNTSLGDTGATSDSTGETDDTSTSSSSGGSQISEITGPTRDLFTNLLSPLARLDSLTGIGNRIYDLLDSRLKSTVSIGNITINGDSAMNVETLADQLEEILGERMAFASGGNV